MTRSLLVGALLLALSPLKAQAQVDGLRLEAGVVLLTKAGAITFGTSEFESDAGVAFRGRLRYGLGFVSIAADVQTSAQKYGIVVPAPGAPQNLNSTFLGATVALHPFSFVGIAPYAEVGLGKLFFSDQSISTTNGSTASTYALGATIGGRGRIGLDVGLRLMRLSNLTAQGIPGEFNYDPKLFSVMLSLRL
jgi:hypothetical protein